jgi:hypothetical protein
MNITNSEEPNEITAKTCVAKNSRKVTYFFVDTYHALSKDKKDLILSEIRACEKLKKYVRDEQDERTIEMEIADLRMILDLLP